MARCAFLYYGIFYDRKSLYHDHNKFINGKKFYINHQKHLWSWLENSGHSYDFYIASYKNEEEAWLKKAYEPKGMKLVKEFCWDQADCKRKRFLDGCDLIMNSGVEYDFVVATRFDILFTTSISKYRIDLETLNVPWVSESGTVCDNLWIFPAKYLADIREAMRVQDVLYFKGFHFALPELMKIFPSCNFWHFSRSDGDFGLYELELRGQFDLQRIKRYS